MSKFLGKLVFVIFALAFPVLLYGNFYFNSVADSIGGPWRMVSGPGGTCYVLMGDFLVRIWDDGTVVSSWSMDDLGVEGELADMGASSDGDVYLGILESGEILRFSPDRNEISPMPFKAMPSASGLGSFWRLMVSPDGSEIYIAETTHKSVSVHSVEYEIDRSINRVTLNEDVPRNTDPVFHWPSRMLMHRGLVYLADSNHQRLMVFEPSGLLEDVYDTEISGSALYRAITKTIDATTDIVDTATKENIPFGGSSNPVALSMSDKGLYVVTINPAYEDRRLIRLNLNTGKFEEVPPLKRTDGSVISPKDILVLGGRLLVADEDEISIEVFSPDGEYEGVFGQGRDDGFDAFADSLRARRDMAIKLRYISLALMLGFLVMLLALNRLSKRTG